MCFENQHSLAGTHWYCVIPGTLSVLDVLQQEKIQISERDRSNDLIFDVVVVVIVVVVDNVVVDENVLLPEKNFRLF